MRRELTGLVGEIPALSGLAPADLAAFVEACREWHVRPGEVVIEEGSRDRDVVLVLRGALEVTRGGEVLGELGPGAIVGLLAPLLGTERTATVRATERAQLAVLRGSSLQLLALSHAPLGVVLQSAMLAQLLDDFVAAQRSWAEGA